MQSKPPRHHKHFHKKLHLHWQALQAAVII